MGMASNHDSQSGFHWRVYVFLCRETRGVAPRVLEPNPKWRDRVHDMELYRRCGVAGEEWFPQNASSSDG